MVSSIGPSFTTLAGHVTSLVIPTEPQLVGNWGIVDFNFIETVINVKMPNRDRRLEQLVDTADIDNFDRFCTCYLLLLLI